MELAVTCIDVGWGDSILVEASNGDGNPAFMLIDSNDRADGGYRPSYYFLRKYLGLRELHDMTKPFFRAVVLTHDHADHGSGLKRLIQQYGTENLWYPKVPVVEESVICVPLQDFARRSSNVGRYQAVDDTRDLGPLGDVTIDVLWPPEVLDSPNPNNHSVVLALTLADVTFLLTGDAEGEVWDQILDRIPDTTRLIKVPHHGSRNGTINEHGQSWTDRAAALPSRPLLAISCHPNFPNRFDFPHDDVLQIFDAQPYEYARTDENYHLTYRTDGHDVSVKCSHI